jgi:mannose-1-phosphate guanylyltransferase
MALEDYVYCVILAGGKGRRLWPCSRSNMPKQFMDFFGVGRTQVQQTYDRCTHFVRRDHILISTNEAYAGLLKTQLPNVPEHNLLIEPIYRNTGPSLVWAAHRIMMMNPMAKIIVIPSDQAIIDEVAFERNINEALDFIRKNDSILTLGVKPTRPEPGYGYIQMGDEVSADVYRVKSFSEKPERYFAQMFMDSGEFYWNTGMFFGSAHCFFENETLFNVSILHDYDREMAAKGIAPTIEQEEQFMQENFSRFPNVSLDSAVLEKGGDSHVLKCEFGWADLGTWHSIYEAMSRGDGDNVVVDSDVILDESEDNVIKLPNDHLAVIRGLKGYIVAEQGNVLFICPKEDSSALVRKYVNEVQMQKGEDYV